MRSAARSSGRFSDTSAETTPTSVTFGHVEALRHEARPDQDVEPARRERVEDPLSGALALDDVAIEPRHAQAGNRSRTSRSTRSVPPPRYLIRGDEQVGQRVASGDARPQ